jgi:cold shock protein
MMRVRATVEFWDEEEGWGALAESEETPGGVFVHFSAIQKDGYKSLVPGQVVEALVVGPLRVRQEGRYRFSAGTVWPDQASGSKLGWTSVPE